MRLNRLLPLLFVSLLTACGGSANQQEAVPAAPAGVEAPAVPAPPAATGSAPATAQPEGEAVESTVSAVEALSPVATAVAAATPQAAGGGSSRWMVGRNYNQLVPSQPTDSPAGKVEVVEVFWYGCGHCYHLDPYLENWRKKGQPAFVDFRRLPVMWNDVNRQHARLFYVLQALGKLDQLHTAVFREIHANGNMLADQDPAKGEALQVAFLKARGIPAADIKRVYRSFPVESALQRAEVLTRRYQVTGVPLMVINGKYTADVGSAGGEQQLLDLVSDLSGGARRR